MKPDLTWSENVKHDPSKEVPIGSRHAPREIARDQPAASPCIEFPDHDDSQSMTLSAQGSTTLKFGERRLLQACESMRGELVAVAMRYLHMHEDAVDAVNTAIARVWAARDRHDPTQNTRGLLVRTLQRCCLDAIRAKKRRIDPLPLTVDEDRLRPLSVAHDYEPDEWVRIQDAAKLLAMKRQGLIRLVREGKIPSAKIDGRRVFRFSDVEAVYALRCQLVVMHSRGEKIDRRRVAKMPQAILDVARGHGRA